MTATILRPRRAPRRRAAERRALALGGTAVAAATGFGVLAAAVAGGATAHADEAIRARVAARRRPAREAAEVVAAPGKWWAYVPAALGVAAYVLAAPEAQGGARGALARLAGRRRRGPRRAAAGAVTLAGVLAAALGPAFDRWLPQPPAPPGHPSRNKPVFPSGHALGPTAVALAAAYVLSREELARPGVAFPAALASPLASAGAKLVQEKHWGSDVLGGHLAAVAVAAACLAAYELAERR
jgi:drug/metabolite transporter (DMT)-like permease